MEKFIVSARKYRPQSFEAVIGQAHITLTLLNAIKNDHVAHSYLFCGPRGVGKTTCARVFAKTLNCQQPLKNFEACNSCEACRAFLHSQSYNIHELDAASNNSVEDIRKLIERIHVKPPVGKYSIYIIDEVHMLSTSAFNAFLKTLEEPPAHVIFILATTEKNKIIPTILSRCQIFDFKRISVSDIVKFLSQLAEKKAIKAELSALNVIARKSDGSLRDALSFFDQIASFSNDEITYKNTLTNLNELDYENYFSLVDFFLESKVTESLLLFDKILYNGFDARFFLQGLANHLRDILICKDPSTHTLLEMEGEIKQKYVSQAGRCSFDFLYKALDTINQFDVQYKDSPNKRWLVELMLIKLCNILIIKEKEIPEAIPKEKPKITQPQPSSKENLKEPKTVKADSPAPQPTAEVTPQSISIRRTSTPKSEPLAAPKAKAMEDTPRKSKSFTQAEVQKVLGEFIKTEELNQRNATTIRKYPPVISMQEHKINLKIDNDLQVKEISGFKSSLVTFLRKKLQNDFINIGTYREATPEKKSKPYTDEEKFTHMSQKNKLLIQLKDEFSLDFER